MAIARWPSDLLVKPAHLILLLAMNFCWAAVYSAYTIIGHDLPSGGIVTLRFGLGGLCLLVLWPWLRGPAPRGRDLAMTCFLGVLVYVVGQRLQVEGNQRGSAGNSGVLLAVEPIITSVAAAIFLRERIGPRRLAGFALGLLGVAVLNGVWRADFQWTGLAASLLFVSSFICEAAYSVLGKPIVTRASPIKMLVISLLVGAAINLLIDGKSTLSLAAKMPFIAWVLVLGMAVVCTAIGYSVWFVVIRDCPVNLAALTVFAQSVFAVLLAALWLGEKLRWDQLLGSLTIATGLALGLSRQVRPARQEG